MIRKKTSIPEPIDPLFKHFHSVDIQVIMNSNELTACVIYIQIDNTKVVTLLFNISIVF